MELTKECLYCKKLFVTENKRQIFCCRKHGKSHNEGKHYTGLTKNTVEDRNIKRFEILHPKYEYSGGYVHSDGYIYVTCKDCGATFRTSAQVTRKEYQIVCSNCRKTISEIKKEEIRKEKDRQKTERYREKYNKPFVQLEFKQCIECGSIFTKGGKYCSTLCGKKYTQRISHKNRELKMRAIIVDKDISLKKLYLRDKGICYLCGCKCSYEDYTIRNGAFIVGQTYPSIEHIYPISKGGMHSWDNVKLACCSCNSKKGSEIVNAI